MHKIEVLIASRDGSIARNFLRDLQIQSEVSGNLENLHSRRVRWMGLTHDGKGTGSLITGVPSLS